jgi:hypothetical protein
MERRRAVHRVAVVYAPDLSGERHRHEQVTQAKLAARLGALNGCDFAGEYNPSADHLHSIYFVPNDTLVGIEQARALGIEGEDDLFGAVVPYPFVATKVISHPLVEPGARAPEGWSVDFGQRVQAAVLPGFSAFAPRDARRAGESLLRRGPLRLKPALAKGGLGQVVVTGTIELEAALDRLDTSELAQHGIVLEENLAEVTTYSVGQVRTAGMMASYWGTQHLTPDNAGAAVYGGSDLFVVRGDFEALLRFEAPEEIRMAVAQARTYDAAAFECFPGLLASRRNYDIARGRDAAGHWRSGVLEQSWRMGGASGAEIAALEAFQANPSLHAVHACTVERYGEGFTPPHGATLYFQGADERVGPMIKYAMVKPHANQG